MTDLIILMSKLVSPNGRILIPGVEEMISPPDEEERYAEAYLQHSLRSTDTFHSSGQFIMDWTTVSPISKNPLAPLLLFPMIRQRFSWVACENLHYLSTESKARSMASVPRLSSPLKLVANSAFGMVISLCPS